MRSHFSTLGDGDILHWLVRRVCPRLLNLSDNIHTLNNLAKDDVLVV